MATCTQCPPGSRDIPDDQMDEHRRAVHPAPDDDEALEVRGSTIVRDVSADADPDGRSEDGEWHH